MGFGRWGMKISAGLFDLYVQRRHLRWTNHVLNYHVIKFLPQKVGCLAQKKKNIGSLMVPDCGKKDHYIFPSVTNPISNVACKDGSVLMLCLVDILFCWFDNVDRWEHKREQSALSLARSFAVSMVGWLNHCTGFCAGRYSICHADRNTTISNKCKFSFMFVYCSVDVIKSCVYSAVFRRSKSIKALLFICRSIKMMFWTLFPINRAQSRKFTMLGGIWGVW